MGNDPWAVRMRSHWPGMKPVISYVQDSCLPRKRAVKATREPGRSGGLVSQVMEVMFSHQAGAFDGSAAQAATASVGRAITISVWTSTVTMLSSP